jgi:hypothetical protein
MNWLSWAILSAVFAGLTAILAKVGVKDVDSNLATAIRTLRDPHSCLAGFLVQQFLTAAIAHGSYPDIPQVWRPALHGYAICVPCTLASHRRWRR